ncbi:centrosomal protein of 44 kDa isoform X1 [Sorex araneus]|uniref:centrosomal protein of 44 kDa isoform X1 n=1 Tax=Sorex araneus TaxID=42254 RepID=UPI00243394C2|nr:centrosomal protein of 44 kDa isoform X1 [Sorex araneus]XP_054997882.1 centrosomal protein of 44 kDa isoform X1 [Sorex araneus]
MATGDLKRSLRKLEQVLRSLNYPKEVDCVGLVKGDTAASLPIISYSLTSYSPYIAEFLLESNVELLAKNDLCFIDTVYKLLRDQFNYKPILTKKQFLQSGFAEWKIQIICDILNCVMKKHKELAGSEKTQTQQRKKSSSNKPEPPNTSEISSAESVGIDITGRFMTSGKKQALVIRHLYNEEAINVPNEPLAPATKASEIFDSCHAKASEIKKPEMKDAEVNTDQEDLKLDHKIIALQTMLTECQEKLEKLAFIESRVDALEEKLKGQVMVNEKSWTNLMSRVTLLETELLLFKKKDESEMCNGRCENLVSRSDVENQNPVSPMVMAPRNSAVTYCGVRDFSEETAIQKMERMKKMFEETAELLKFPNH